MRKLLFLIFFITSVAEAALPLAFTSVPSVNNMAVGQTQHLDYVIRNNVPNQSLPLQSISIINKGDNQPAWITQIVSNCGAKLPPKTSCNIRVVVNEPQSGNLNRVLSINYGGRAPLTAPIFINTQSAAAYTILVYIVGADLESRDGSATFNINQMKQVGSSSSISIVIETGGAKKPGWLTVQRKLIVKNGEILIKDLGRQNMGLQSSVEDFFLWGVKQYPANKYIAVFWNHGGGPNYGFGGDELFRDAATPINQLSAAMRKVTQETGKTFEIIGFDTCLLGNVETYSGLYHFTNYLIGSQDLEPGLGWQYNTFLNFVNNNPTANGLQIGTVIADGFTAQNKGDSTTSSVVSAAAVPNLINAINQFSTALSPYMNSTVPNWKLVARGRTRTPDYSTSVWDNKSTDVADLTGLANGMAQAISGDTAIQSTSNALKAAVMAAVKYRKNSENRGSAFGLTIYFPSILKAYVRNYPNVTLLNGQSFFSTTYTSIINNYFNFYVSQAANLVALPTGLGFDGVNYTAVVSNDFEEALATVGNNNCTNVFLDDNTHLTSVPCYTALQINGINESAGPNNTWNISYNKADNANNWPLLNGQPVLLIALDTEPVIPNEVSYIIPVTRVGGGNGYLSVIKNDNNIYEVSGFQSDAGTSNTKPKTSDIEKNERFYIRTYAQLSSGFFLLRTNTVVTAPFTITFGHVTPQFNAFRFLVADLTGALNISANSVPY